MISYVISNTGPLISVFQAKAIDVIKQVVEKIYITPSCSEELYRHGWQKETDAEIKGGFIEVCSLNEEEKELARAIAEEIALRAQKKDAEHHRGEADALALANRTIFKDYPVLLDEKAARMVAKERNKNLSGFAGLLIRATERGIIVPEQAKQFLEICQRQGTRYTQGFINSVYEMCKEVYKL